MGWEIQVSLLTSPAETFAIVDDFESFTFEDVLSDTGSAKVVIDAEEFNDAWVNDNTYWRFLEDGVPRFGFLPEVVEDLVIEEDEDPKVQVSGRGAGAVLEWGIVYPRDFGTAGAKVQRDWVQRSYPDVLHSMLTEAQRRGTLDFVDVLSWQSSGVGVVPSRSMADSSGQTWNGIVDSYVRAGEDLLALTKRWAGIHPFDWHVDPDFSMDVWLAAGSDKSATVVLHPGGAITEQTVTRVRRSLRNIILIEDSQEKVYAISDEDSILKWHQRETYIKPDEAINEGSATAVGYPLLETSKDEQVERVIAVSPQQGRRPYVDYGLGDLVGIKFDVGIVAMRCFGITVGVDGDGNESIEAVVESILGPDSIDAVKGDISGGAGNSGPTLVYSELSGDFTATTTASMTMPMAVQAVSPTNGRAGINLHGTASTAMDLTASVYFGNVLAKTFKFPLHAGEQTVGLPFILAGIPESQETWRIQLQTSTGTFAMPTGKSNWWIESNDLAGGLGSGTPAADHLEPVNQVPYATITEDKLADLQVPVSSGKLEIVDWDPVLVTDPSVVTFGFDQSPEVGTDDGWVSTSPTIVTTGPQLEAGNSAGELRGLWVRVPAPPPMAGRTIVKATLVGTLDAATIAPVRLKIRADISGSNPAAPESKAQFDSRAKTAAAADWDIASGVATGTKLTSPNFASVIQEVVNLVGSPDYIQLFVEDDASDTDGRVQFRSFENTTLTNNVKTPMRLFVEYGTADPTDTTVTIEVGDTF